MNEDTLLEYMEEIKAIAASQQGRLARGEIEAYLDDLGLDSGGIDAVCQYLCSSGIHVEGYRYVPDSSWADGEKADSREAGTRRSEKSRITGGKPVSRSSEGKTAGSPAGRKRPDNPAAGTLQQRAGTYGSVSGQRRPGVQKGASQKRQKVTKAQRNVQLYRQEVSALEGCTPEQEMELMGRFLSGEFSLRNEILQGYLSQVLDMAKRYQKRDVPMDDIIAEGNMGLMNAMAMLEQGGDAFLDADGLPEMRKIYSAIEMEVQQAIELMIDGTTEDRDWENTIVARTNLLHEAAKYLAEEMGRTATVEELSEYTRIPIREIHDIMGLSAEVRKAF